MPIQPYSAGDSTSEPANTRPIDEPMTAMILVRCCSRTRSATSAVAAAEIAPVPCRMRAAIIQLMSGAQAAITLPAA